MLKYTFKKGNDTAVELKSMPYNWDGTVSTFTIYVDGSNGLIGKPSLKSVDAYDWKYLHGTTPDLRNRRYMNKEITLSCWMTADSKQQLVERYDQFLTYFRHDDYILMKVTWDTDNDNGGIAPNPHASKGIFALVYLNGVQNVRHKWRKGFNAIRFELCFIDPYPMKQVLKYEGTEGNGVDYDIVSETEIDIYTENGDIVYDILTGTGHIDCIPNRYILLCGDVVHATNSNGGTTLVTPSNTRDEVNLIYSEI